MKLTKAALEMLNRSHCFDEVADDYVSVANCGIVILLCKRAVESLNLQAAEAADGATNGDAA